MEGPVTRHSWPRCPALLLESPRWLLATLQLDRARKTLQALAEDNCPQDSLLAGVWGTLRATPKPWFVGGGVTEPALSWIPFSLQSWRPCPRCPHSPGTTLSVRSAAPGSSGRTASSSALQRECWGFHGVP